MPEKRYFSGQSKQPMALSSPRILYNPALPIFEKKDAIIAAIKKHPVVIIAGETGSGKTTQIPKFCLAAGRGVKGKIGCTQPRRIAAVTVAQRIAEELNEPLGVSVGYKIRFTDKTPKNACIKVMTDGILLAETRNDPRLYQYDTLIVDEAHERSLNIDFILGILKTLTTVREDLKLIITSATIDTEKFSNAFHQAPIIEVSGRMYPVDVTYMPFDEDDSSPDAPSYVEKAVEAVDHLQHGFPKGDILVFMPTGQDIMETKEIIEGRKYARVSVLPLFARLSAKDQTRVFSKMPGTKIIIATNIAETSITIPGIKYVIDTGLARIPRFNPRTRTTSLKVGPISKSSADQRKGRCGRVANGVCIRLYSESNYLSRPDYTPPEILRANLAEVILNMTALGIGDIWDFPFIDPPLPKSITDGFDLLTELNAIIPEPKKSVKGKRPAYQLTAKGRQMAKLPLDPRLSCILLAARKRGCEKEVLVIASALSIMDPRERPMEKTQAADAAHVVFTHPASDFLGLLNVWKAYAALQAQGKSNSRLRSFCKDHFLSFKRMREWQDVHSQIQEILDQSPHPEVSPVKIGAKGPANEDAVYAAIHCSILSGFLSNIALRKENNFYTAAKGREVMLFPGSVLFGKARPWIVCAEIVETNRVYARTAAAVEPAWLEAVGNDLCNYTYSNALWDRKRGEVTAIRQASLFGLIIAQDRKVSYGPLHPDEATEIFIQSALVDGRMDTIFPFMAHNQKLMDEARDMENRLRRKDVLADNAALFCFYKDRLKICYSVATLKKTIKEKSGDGFLKMTPDDVFRYLPDKNILDQYPHAITLGGHQMPCEYVFAPGKDMDGVTVKIPAALAPSIPIEETDWLVPGLFAEKITGLIKGLPKTYRKQLIPISETVDIICREMPKAKGPLLTLLGKFIYKRFKVDIPHSQWSDSQLPEYLNLRIALVDPHGKEIAGSRDKSILTKAHEQTPMPDILDAARKKWERIGITAWDFPDLPETIEMTASDGTPWKLFPGLSVASADFESTIPGPIHLKLFTDAEKAGAEHKAGVTALYQHYFSKDMKFLKKALVIPQSHKAQARLLGGKRRLEALLFAKIMKELFFVNIRTQKEFASHGEKTAMEILPLGQTLRGQILPVMDAYYDAHMTLERLRRENRFKPLCIDFIEDIMAQARHLVPEDFIPNYTSQRMAQLDRYLKALVIRAERGILDPEKDRQKFQDIKPHLANRQTLVETLSSNASLEKKEVLEAYTWLIEEYKVSVFAQELKTAVTVSPKILNRKFQDLLRMA